MVRAARLYLSHTCDRYLLNKDALKEHKYDTQSHERKKSVVSECGMCFQWSISSIRPCSCSSLQDYRWRWRKGSGESKGTHTESDWYHEREGQMLGTAGKTMTNISSEVRRWRMEGTEGSCYCKPATLKSRLFIATQSSHQNLSWSTARFTLQTVYKRWRWPP